MKKALVISWLLVLLSGISYLFWHDEWKYSLPTPVPVDYHAVNTGDVIDIGTHIKLENNKPVFLHFFNPECPCSRFNIPHYNSLVKHYGDKVTFAIVVMNSAKDYTAEYVQDKFGLSVPVLFDASLAAECGVYSTPQAVIIDAGHKLYYRGNYNKSRYCTDKNSNYAQMALDSLLGNDLHPIFNQFAVKAYGCELPTCKR